MTKTVEFKGTGNVENVYGMQYRAGGSVTEDWAPLWTYDIATSGNIGTRGAGLEVDTRDYDDYRDLRLDFEDVQQTSDGQHVKIAMTTDNFSTLESNYRYTVHRMILAQSAIHHAYGTGVNGVEFINALGNDSYAYAFGTLHIWNRLDTARDHTFFQDVCAWDNYSKGNMQFSTWSQNPAAAATGFEIFTGAGALDAGRFALYGRNLG